MLFPYQRGANKCRSAPSVEVSENYSCTVPARTHIAFETSLICFRSFVKILQGKNVTGVAYESLCANFMLRRFHSISMFLVRNKL